MKRNAAMMLAPMMMMPESPAMETPMATGPAPESQTRLLLRLQRFQDEWRATLSNRELTPSLFDSLLGTIHALHALATTSLLGPPPMPDTTGLTLEQAFAGLSTVPLAEYLQQAGPAVYDPLPPLPRDLLDLHEYLTLFDDHLLCISSRQCVANAKRKTFDAMRQLHSRMPQSQQQQQQQQQQQGAMVDLAAVAAEMECLRAEIVRAEHDVALFKSKLAHMLRSVHPVHGLATRTELRRLLDAELHQLMTQRRMQLVTMRAAEADAAPHSCASTPYPGTPAV